MLCRAFQRKLIRSGLNSWVACFLNPLYSLPLTFHLWFVEHFIPTFTISHVLLLYVCNKITHCYISVHIQAYLTPSLLISIFTMHINNINMSSLLSCRVLSYSVQKELTINPQLRWDRGEAAKFAQASVGFDEARRHYFQHYGSKSFKVDTFTLWYYSITKRMVFAKLGKSTKHF